MKIKTCKCGSDMNRQLPKLLGLKTTETVDKFSNRKFVADHKEILNTRKQDHYWSVDVPKMVNSGIYALDTMLDLPEGSKKKELENAMQGHILSEDELNGTYNR